MNNIIFKTTLIKGAQGAKGDPGEGDSIPTKSVIAYDGEEIPEGYIRTDAPAEFQALETRLNNIIAHPIEGETTAEELVDVRVSAYGETYDSAGDAVRGQVDILQEQIDRLLDNTIQGSGEGEIVSYENGSDILPMKSAKVYLEPKQDLHGYDFPWVGGAGKNKYIGSPSFDGYETISAWTLQDEKYNGHDVYKRTGSWSGCYKLVYLPVGTYTFSCMVKTNDSAKAFMFGKVDNVTTAKITPNNTQYTTSTSWSKMSGTFEVTTAGTVAFRVERNTNGDIYISEFQLEKGTQATTYAPYSNICPITGYTEVGVDISNANLWDETVLEGLWNHGERIEVANRICSNYIYVKGLNGQGQTPNGVRWVSSQNTPEFSAYDENKNYLYDLPYTEDTDGIWVPIPEAAYYVTFNFDNSYGGTYLNDTALLRPITKTEYVAHEGKEYNVQIKNRNLLQLTLENIMNLNSDWDWTLQDGVLTCDKGDDAYKWVIYFKTNGLIRIHAIAQGTPGYDELFLPIPEGGYPSGTYYAKYTGGSDLLKVYCDVGQNVIVDEYEIIENQIRAASVVVSGLDSLLDDVCICKDTEDLNLPIYIKGAPDDVTYGGYVDVVNGDLMVGRVYLKGGWTQYASSNGYNAYRKTVPTPKGSNLLCNPVSNMISEFGQFSSGNMDRNIIQLLVSGTNIAYMALQEDANSDNVELCYELATPITYQLTKHEVLALLGDNNVYSKDGSVAVIYRQDTNLVIQDILSRLEG